MKKNYFLILTYTIFLFTVTACSHSEGHHHEHEEGEHMEHDDHHGSEDAVKMPVRNAEQTKAVLEHHLKSFGENNIDELMADYAEDAILIAPDATLKGTDQIKAFFLELFPAFPTEGTEFTMDKMEIDNEFAYILWHADTPAIEVPLGSDTFVIEDGKIVKQSFAGLVSPKETEEVAG